MLFLDIDGVLNSARSCLAFGGYPMELDEIGAFDQIAIRLIQRLCDADDQVQVVLSSAWRLHCDYNDVGAALGLPIIDRTPSLLGPRGKEIAAWLDGRDDVEAYAIVDDDSDMLPEQMPRFVNTDGENGLMYADFIKLCALLNVAPVAAKPRAREWRGKSKKLDWSEA